MSGGTCWRLRECSDVRLERGGNWWPYGGRCGRELSPSTRPTGSGQLLRSSPAQGAVSPYKSLCASPAPRPACKSVARFWILTKIFIMCCCLEFIFPYVLLSYSLKAADQENNSPASSCSFWVPSPNVILETSSICKSLNFKAWYVTLFLHNTDLTTNNTNKFSDTFPKFLGLEVYTWDSILQYYIT